MKEIISNIAPDIFEAMKPSMRSNLKAENLADFLDLVNNTNSKLYNFIEVR